MLSLPGSMFGLEGGKDFCFCFYLCFFVSKDGQRLEHISKQMKEMEN